MAPFGLLPAVCKTLDAGSIPATASKRIALAAQLQTKLGELEKLRAVAAGKASADAIRFVRSVLTTLRKLK